MRARGGAAAARQARHALGQRRGVCGGGATVLSCVRCVVVVAAPCEDAEKVCVVGTVAGTGEGVEERDAATTPQQEGCAVSVVWCGQGCVQPRRAPMCFALVDCPASPALLPRHHSSSSRPSAWSVESVLPSSLSPLSNHCPPRSSLHLTSTPLHDHRRPP